MTQFFAILALLALSTLNTLGNFWFVYGVWPRSWGALCVFTITSLILYSLFGAVQKESK